MRGEQNLVGSTIDGWRITGKLGEGAMGIVYEARKEGRLAAFKVALPDLLGPDNLQRFRREAGILQGLEHPHIVRCYHAGEAERFVYLALEHLPGGSLEEVLAERQRLSVPQAVGVIRRVLLGLSRAHESKVLHRDIKPGNVLFDERGVPKLADFGLARAKGQARITVAGSVLGTVDYMSPEQFEFIGEIDQRADLYSVGGLLFHLVTGHPPYQGRSSLSVLQQHRDAPIPQPSAEVPEAAPLDAVVDTLMAKGRDDRPRTARAALELLAGLPEEPLRPGDSLDPPEPPPAPRRPSRALDGLAALAALLVALGAGDALLVARGTDLLAGWSHAPALRGWLLAWGPVAAALVGALLVDRLVARLSGRGLLARALRR